MPHRRTFVKGILPFTHSLPAALPASMPPLAAKAGSRGMGSPEFPAAGRKPLFSMNPRHATPGRHKNKPARTTFWPCGPAL